MRLLFTLAICAVSCSLCGAQPSGSPPDPASEPLNHAYDALITQDYDAAISHFLKAIDLAPQQARIRKDLAYTYLKIGDNALARDQFHQAMLLDSKEFSVA